MLTELTLEYGIVFYDLSVMALLVLLLLLIKSFPLPPVQGCRPVLDIQFKVVSRMYFSQNDDCIVVFLTVTFTAQ